MRERPATHFKSADSQSGKSGLPAIAVWVSGGIAALLALTGAFFLGVGSKDITEVEILIPTPAPIVVQVSGEVLVPGIYELDADKRVFEAIELAGGLTKNADAGRLNLAAIVKDGSRIEIPALATATPPFTDRQSSGGPDHNMVSATPGLESAAAYDPLPGSIDLNTASADELESLPGIGETRAKQIIALREALGRITSLEQLLEIHGIGEGTLETIRPFVVVR